MCGIVGFIAPKASQEWKKRTLDRLLLSARGRGGDATGIGYVDPNTQKMIIVKAGEEAGKFVYHNKDYEAATKELPSVVLGHTRAATCHSEGGASNAKNNHPFF